jgi:hypothetical protein
LSGIWNDLAMPFRASAWGGAPLTSTPRRKFAGAGTQIAGNDVEQRGLAGAAAARELASTSILQATIN